MKTIKTFENFHNYIDIKTISDCFLDLEDAGFIIKVSEYEYEPFDNPFYNEYIITIIKSNEPTKFDAKDVSETILFAKSYLESEFGLKLKKIEISHQLTHELITSNQIDLEEFIDGGFLAHKKIEKIWLVLDNDF